MTQLQPLDPYQVLDQRLTALETTCAELRREVQELRGIVRPVFRDESLRPVPEQRR